MGLKGVDTWWMLSALANLKIVNSDNSLVEELFGVQDSLAEALFGAPVAGESATLVPVLA